MSSAFPGQISNRNFLSPVGFKFSLSKYPKVAFYCNSAKIPDIILGTETQNTYLKDIDVPGDKITYGDFSLKFLIDEDMVNYMSIHNWITGLGFPESAEQYKKLVSNQDGVQDSNLAFSDGTLYILDSNFNANIVVKFKDLYPVSLGAVEFDATRPDIQYFTSEVVFKYTIYSILDKNNKPL
jgi:hypothetical protein